MMVAGRAAVGCAPNGVGRKFGMSRRRARLAVKRLGLERASKMEGPRGMQRNIAGRLECCDKTDKMLFGEKSS